MMRLYSLERDVQSSSFNRIKLITSTRLFFSFVLSRHSSFLISVIPASFLKSAGSFSSLDTISDCLFVSVDTISECLLLYRERCNSWLPSGNLHPWHVSVLRIVQLKQLWDFCSEVFTASDFILFIDANTSQNHEIHRCILKLAWGLEKKVAQIAI